jgi:hypothetical protein
MEMPQPLHEPYWAQPFYLLGMYLLSNLSSLPACFQNQSFCPSAGPGS